MADGPRLTSLAHGGGCGCKLSPAVLQELLAKLPPMPGGNLLVGTQTGDDAAVFRLNDQQALVATTDFFMPIVDDPYDFGRIAATNALSDVYAMGGTPILALAVLGMPLGGIATEDVQQILAGGAAVCAEAGIAVAGGHSIDSREPIYGLVALGLVHPERILRNSGARAGDRIILTKGLGIGVFGAALKQDRLDRAGYAEMLRSATQRNAIGSRLGTMAGVHAVTDVTGFGLLGHLLEMCCGAGVSAIVAVGEIPILAGAEELARAGFKTGGASRNWDSYGNDVTLDEGWHRDLLCDPQTSGGLLIAVAPEAAQNVLRQIHEAGFQQAKIIGEFREGRPEIR